MTIAFEVSKKLMAKQNGKVTYLTPTTDQITKIVINAESFVSALQEFYDFSKNHEDKFPALKTLPITKDDLDKLSSDLETIKKLPY